MIRITCPGCRSKLHAKDELAGQTRNCPKCGTAIGIGAPATPSESAAENGTAAAQVAADQHAHGWAEEALPEIPVPQRLLRQNHYLICDNSKVFAAWENNGDGWMLRTTAGFISAVRNSEKLPAQGVFRLVELKMAMVDDVLRLDGIAVCQLAKRWALTTLNQGDDRILGTVTGPGSLNKDQKFAIRKHLSEHFMRNVWENADAVMDYLSNTDYHSSGVSGTAASASPTGNTAGPTDDRPG
jgi:hypothetical protein